MQRSARPCRLALALVALGALASCSDSDPAGAGGGFRLEDGESLGEGIFAIDLGDRSIVQLAAIPGQLDDRAIAEVDREDAFAEALAVLEPKAAAGSCRVRVGARSERPERD